MKAREGVRGAPAYIVDGYNVILSERRRFDTTDIERARERLLRCLAAYARERKVSVTVVWDGAQRGGARREAPGGVRSIFTSRGTTADQKIVYMVERSANPRSITVVSDDRRHITGIARNLGAQVMPVGAFLRLTGCLPAGGRRPAGARREQGSGREPEPDKSGADDLSVEEWLRLFKADMGG
ncbi:MAG: NYN domain-containing protein [Spirochaetota bacterium]